MNTEKSKKMKKKEFKIGDKVETYLLRTTGSKVKVKGVIKSINTHYGSNTYTLTKCIVEDFPARNIKQDFHIFAFNIHTYDIITLNK